MPSLATAGASITRDSRRAGGGRNGRRRADRSGAGRLRSTTAPNDLQATTVHMTMQGVEALRGRPYDKRIESSGWQSWYYNCDWMFMDVFEVRAEGAGGGRLQGPTPRKRSGCGPVSSGSRPCGRQPRGPQGGGGPRPPAARRLLAAKSGGSLSAARIPGELGRTKRCSRPGPPLRSCVT
jgi:hypothetical protein